MQWKQNPIVALVFTGVLLAVGALWPWTQSDGYILTFDRPAYTSNRNVKVSIWRSRSGKLVVRTDGLLGPVCFVVDPRLKSVRRLFDSDITTIGPWMLVQKNAGYHIPGPLPETDEVDYQGDLVEIRNPDVNVRLRMR